MCLRVEKINGRGKHNVNVNVMNFIQTPTHKNDFMCEYNKCIHTLNTMYWNRWNYLCMYSVSFLFCKPSKHGLIDDNNVQQA